MSSFRVGSNVTVQLFEDRIDMVVNQTAQKAVNRASITAMSRAKAMAPTDSGKLRNSITRTLPAMVSRRTWSAIVHSTLDYALYQEKGTRAHGPVRAKFLRFKPKGSRKYVYAKWVRGVPAQNYLKRAVESLRVSDFT